MRPRRQRRTEILLRTIAAAILACGAVAVSSQDSPDTATIHLRDGTKVWGQIEMLADGEILLRRSIRERRRIRLVDVELIDRQASGSVRREAEVREARGAAHLLVFHSGSTVKGRLMAIKNSGQGDLAPTLVFRTFDGRERRYTQSEVARLYFGTTQAREPLTAHPVRSLTARASRSNDGRTAARSDE